MPQSTRGFTLIELMVVVAIIATLATLALPSLQNQLARAQATAALTELRSLQGPYEALLWHDPEASFSAAALGLSGDSNSAISQRCELLIRAPEASTAAGALRCTLRGHPLISGLFIELQREALSGRWTCLSNLPESLTPSGCGPDTA